MSTPGAWQRIELRDVSCAFDRQYALQRVTTSFEAGRLVALLGANGAGKSTLISVLATLRAPDRGTVLFDGFNLDTVRRDQRDRIGLVSHDALLYADLSGTENLLFFGRLYGVQDPAGRARELIDRVGLSTKAAERPVRTYSRGMRQRLSIARALVQSPCLLLLDEPFTGIDRDGAALIEDILRAEKSAGRMVLMSTHRLDMGGDLVDEVRVLEGGRLRADRPLHPGETLLDAYRAPVKTPGAL